MTIGNWKDIAGGSFVEKIKQWKTKLPWCKDHTEKPRRKCSYKSNTTTETTLIRIFILVLKSSVTDSSNLGCLTIRLYITSSLFVYQNRCQNTSKWHQCMLNEP